MIPLCYTFPYYYVLVSLKLVSHNKINIAQSQPYWHRRILLGWRLVIKISWSSYYSCIPFGVEFCIIVTYSQSVKDHFWLLVTCRHVKVLKQVRDVKYSLLLYSKVDSCKINLDYNDVNFRDPNEVKFCLMLGDSEIG